MDKTAEEILYEHLTKGQDNYLAGQRGNVLKAMEQYHQSRLSELREKVEPLLQNLEFIANEDPINRKALILENVGKIFNLIDNMEP